MRPKVAKMRPKRAKRRPKTAKRRPNRAKRRAKMAKMRPKRAKRRPKRAKRRPQEGQEELLDASCSALLKTLAMRCPELAAKALKGKTFHAAVVYVCMHCGLIAAVFGGFCVCGASHLRSDFLVHTGGQDAAQGGQDEAQEDQKEPPRTPR